MTPATVKRIARECGFELAGIARAEPAGDFEKYQQWLQRGFAGEMRYLTDHRAEARRDPRQLLESAKTIVCVGKLYNTSAAHSGSPISRYAWGQDYHDVLRVAAEVYGVDGFRAELVPRQDVSAGHLQDHESISLWQ